MCIRDSCYDNHKEWQKYLASTEVFLNIRYHHFIENTPYLMMFGRKPHREIQELIEFPNNPEDPYDENKWYSRIMEKIEKQKAKYSQNQPKIIKYNEGERVLIKNRELPSTIEGVSCLLYTSRCV